VLTVTVPSLADFRNSSVFTSPYVLRINDTLSAGLTIPATLAPSNLTITASPATVPALPTPIDTTVISEVNVSGGGGTPTNLEIIFNPDFINHQDRDGRTYTISYTATLNEHAVIGAAGNTNTVTLTFSNDPYTDGGTETTPPEITTVYTFDFDIFKFQSVTSAAQNPLAGAQFNLYNTPAAPVTSGPGADTPLTFTSTAGDGTNPTVYRLASGGNALIESPASGLMTVEGLAAGTYWLAEVAAPAGYALLSAPVQVTIVHTGNGAYTINGTAGLRIDIENDQGNLLPETGGMGRTVLYTTGGLLMGAASLMFVYRKKTAKKN
jgi:fimbrial isopeptide formation D2 family protein/LPXTG-motif cell wall-anchored protein